MNKQQTIEYLKQGGKVRILTTKHKFYGMDRKAEKVQTQSIRFEGGSWLYFKDLNPNWIYSQGFKIDDLEGGFIEYAFMDMELVRKLEDNNKNIRS